MSTTNTATYENIESLAFPNNFALGYQISTIAGRLAGKLEEKTRTATQGVKGAFEKIANMYNDFANGDFLSDVRERDFAKEYAIHRDCEQYEKIKYNPVNESYEFA
jgi:hypothetical protein